MLPRVFVPSIFVSLARTIISHSSQGKDAVSAQEQLRQLQSACAAADGKANSLAQQNVQLQQQMRSMQVRSHRNQ
jgi:hypothetical protein